MRHLAKRLAIVVALVFVDGARLLKEALIKKGWRSGKELKYVEAEGAEHNERAWAARVEQILEFLFPGKM